MVKVFEIYCYICAGIISIGILAGLIGVVANVVVYVSRSCVGMNIWFKAIKLYREQNEVTYKIKPEDIKENNNGR